MGAKRPEFLIRKNAWKNDIRKLKKCRSLGPLVSSGSSERRFWVMEEKNSQGGG